jgi:hypothetical protein
MLYPQHLPTIHQPHKAKCNEHGRRGKQSTHQTNRQGAMHSHLSTGGYNRIFINHKPTMQFGSKRPIFETARLAGIMGAKKLRI